MKLVSSKFSVFCFSFLCTTAANALTLDAFSFTAPGTPSSARFESGSIGQRVSTVQNFGGAYGGTRSIELVRSHGSIGSDFNAIFQNGQMGINSSFSGAGDAFISYDGNNTAGLNNYRGLCSGSSCLNLREGNATGLQLGLIFDYSGGRTLPLELTFYDASDVTGNTYSRATLNLDRKYHLNQIYHEDIFVPFSSLSLFGSGGLADLSNIGAFSIAVKGAGNFAYDISFANFRTDASLSNPIPEPTTVGLFLAGVLGFIRRRKAL